MSGSILIKMWKILLTVRSLKTKCWWQCMWKKCLFFFFFGILCLVALFIFCGLCCDFFFVCSCFFINEITISYTSMSWWSSWLNRSIFCKLPRSSSTVTKEQPWSLDNTTSVSKGLGTWMKPRCVQDYIYYFSLIWE